MEKYQLEFVLKSSIAVLYNAIATPSGMSEWFADNVYLRKKNYVFVWDGFEEEAEIISKKTPVHIKFRMLEDEDKPYFEFRIEVDEVTNDVSLMVTDFAEDETDKEDAQLLWAKQIDKLKRVLGS